MLDEFGRDLADELHEQGAVDAHARVVDLGAGLLPQVDRLGVAELAADLFEDFERLVVNELDRFVRHDLIDGDVADEGREGRHCPGAHAPPALAAAGAAAMGRNLLGHFICIDGGAGVFHGSSLMPAGAMGKRPKRRE